MIQARGEDAAAVWAKGSDRDTAAVAREFGEQRAVPRIPYPRGFVIAGGDDPAAVQAKHRTIDVVVVPSKLEKE